MIDKMELTKKETIIGEVMAWYVGRCLSYIDVTVEDTNRADRYTKCKVLKRLFEEQIYKTRNDMFVMEELDILDNAKDIFSDLIENLKPLCVASMPDEASRKAFISLVLTRANEAQVRLIVGLKEGINGFSKISIRE